MGSPRFDQLAKRIGRLFQRYTQHEVATVRLTGVRCFVFQSQQRLCLSAGSLTSRNEVAPRIFTLENTRTPSVLCTKYLNLKYVVYGIPGTLIEMFARYRYSHVLYFVLEYTGTELRAQSSH